MSFRNSAVKTHHLRVHHLSWLRGILLCAIGAALLILPAMSAQAQSDPPNTVYLPHLQAGGNESPQATPKPSATRNPATGTPEPTETPEPDATSSIATFFLVNADSDEDIRPLTNGDRIDLDELPNITVRVQTDPDTVGSVEFTLNGNSDADGTSVVENVAPYALSGDNEGNYHPWRPQPAMYTIRAVPFDESNAGGIQGAESTIMLHVHDNSDPSPTNTPTPEETPTATETPVPNGPLDGTGDVGFWHPPTDHEHGDPPPDWADQWSIEQFGHPVIYGGDEQTSNEWLNKPRAFKAFHATFHGVDIYWRYHGQSNPMGHDARFHSYEIYAKDSTGNISFWQGWLDFGVDDNTLPTVRVTCEDTSVRPIMAVNALRCDEYNFESWYSRAGGSGGWSWDTGLNMQSTFYHDGVPYDMSTWTPASIENKGLTRRMELAWYKGRTDRTFKASGLGGYDHIFYATQFGQLISGPDDPVCGSTATYGERTYTVKCLPQYIASTMPEISFPGNSHRNVFECPDCTLPN